MNGGTKCNGDITTGTTLVDIITVGGVVCSNGTVATPMNVFASGAMDATETAAIQAWIDAGAPQFCPRNLHRFGWHEYHYLSDYHDDYRIGIYQSK